MSLASKGFSLLNNTFLRTISTSASFLFPYKPKIANITANDDDKVLTLEWEDGKTGVFPYVWLKDCSPDEKTYHIQPAMKARKLLMTDFDTEVIPTKTMLTTDRKWLDIWWPDGTESEYHVDWLRFRNHSDPEQCALRRKAYLNDAVTWGNEEIKGRLQSFEYNNVINDKHACHDWLQALCKDGLVLITDSPAKEHEVVDKLIEKIGMSHQTRFGDTWKVEFQPNDPSYLAESHNGEAGLHTDLSGHIQPPNLQMFHMITKSASGGQTLFVDGFRVAEQLRAEQREAYDLLSTVSLEFADDGFNMTQDDKKMYFNNISRHKIINLDEKGKFDKIFYSPHIRSWFMDIAEDQMLPMYRALKMFVNYAYQERNLSQIQLEKGDVVLFANDRILHGRRAFEGARKMDGCYLNWDIVRSRIRELRDKLQLPQNQPSI